MKFMFGQSLIHNPCINTIKVFLSLASFTEQKSYQGKESKKVEQKDQAKHIQEVLSLLRCKQMIIRRNKETIIK